MNEKSGARIVCVVIVEQSIESCFGQSECIFYYRRIFFEKRAEEEA